MGEFSLVTSVTANENYAHTVHLHDNRGEEKKIFKFSTLQKIYYSKMGSMSQGVTKNMGWHSGCT